jgi:biopolymer transport protein ExbB/TolQ
MIEPYATPQSPPDSSANDEQVRRRRKFWLRAMWISIVGVIVPPMFGMIGTVFSMVGAFGDVARTGTADTEALAGNISLSLLSTAWGFVVSTIAFLALIGVLIRFFTLPKAVIPHQQKQIHNES